MSLPRAAKPMERYCQLRAQLLKLKPHLLGGEVEARRAVDAARAVSMAMAEMAQAMSPTERLALEIDRRAK